MNRWLAQVYRPIAQRYDDCLGATGDVKPGKDGAGVFPRRALRKIQALIHVADEVELNLRKVQTE